MDNGYQLVLQRLREERERRYLTQRLLCYCVKMQQSHYSKTETGHRRFSYREMKGLCTSDVDILYTFTGKRAGSGREFPASSAPGPEEILCYLNTIYILADTAWSMHHDRASLDKIREHLEYIRYGTENAGTKDNAFYYTRVRCGYTQQEMADILGMDIKKLRALEKGKLLPDSEIVWKMYDRFRISPAFILKDPKGLWNELNYVLDLLEEDDRETVLRILEQEQKLIHCR